LLNYPNLGVCTFKSCRNVPLPMVYHPVCPAVAYGVSSALSWCKKLRSTKQFFSKFVSVHQSSILVINSCTIGLISWWSESVIKWISHAFSIQQCSRWSRAKTRNTLQRVKTGLFTAKVEKKVSNGEKSRTIMPTKMKCRFYYQYIFWIGIEVYEVTKQNAVKRLEFFHCTYIL
jgi:hypothetical protein